MDGQGALVQGAGVVEVALVVQDEGEVVETLGGGGVVRAEVGVVDGQGALEWAGGLCGRPVAQDDGEVEAGGGSGWSASRRVSRMIGRLVGSRRRSCPRTLSRLPGGIQRSLPPHLPEQLGGVRHAAPNVAAVWSFASACPRKTITVGLPSTGQERGDPDDPPSFGGRLAARVAYCRLPNGSCRDSQAHAPQGGAFAVDPALAAGRTSSSSRSQDLVIVGPDRPRRVGPACHPHPPVTAQWRPSTEFVRCSQLRMPAASPFGCKCLCRKTSRITLECSLTS